MIRNAIFWANHIKEFVVPEIDYFRLCLTERLLPTFENLEKEAEKVEEDEFEKLSHSPYLAESDGADLAEMATDRALTYFETMVDMKQSIINLFAAGIYHQFEQHLLLFHRRELLKIAEDKEYKFIRLMEVKKRLATHGIYIENFKSWSKICELRLLANVVKHGEGDSSKQLWEVNPSLFEHPKSDLIFISGCKQRPIYSPLSGHDVYLDIETFNEYVEILKEFWDEFIQNLNLQH